MDFYFIQGFIDRATEEMRAENAELVAEISRLESLLAAEREKNIKLTEERNTAISNMGYLYEAIRNLTDDQDRYR